VARFRALLLEKNFVNPGMSPDTLIPGDDFSAGLSG
jgi:hypothetical protein